MKKTKTIKASSATELGRRGGLKGGVARAQAMSPEKRTEAASMAAQTRWDEQKGVIRATHSGTLLKLNNLECAVLPGGIRVISQRTLTRGLGRDRPGGRGDVALESMPKFLSAQNLEPFISPELRKGVLEPILYRATGPAGGGQPAHGIRAELVPDICKVWLDAQRAAVLKPQQYTTAKMAEVLLHGLARTGIIALVDEATGYQYDRARDDLAKVLETFLTKELADWVKTFDDDFYRELFRLRSLRVEDITKKKPRYFGHLTNDIVYDRLAPGIRDELQRRNPTDEVGHRKNRHHQHLTPEFGHPKLREHLAMVTGLMKISPDYKTFKSHLDKVTPKFKKLPGPGQTLRLPGID